MGVGNQSQFDEFMDNYWIIIGHKIDDRLERQSIC